MDIYAEAFVKHQVDAKKLLSDEVFTEQFVTEVLGISNKLHAKKLVGAAKRLQADALEHTIGSEFDSTAEKGPFKFTLGQGKVLGNKAKAFASVFVLWVTA